MTKKLQVLQAKQAKFSAKLAQDKNVQKKTNMTKLRNQVKSSVTRVTKKNGARLLRVQTEKKAVQAKIVALQARVTKQAKQTKKATKIQKRGKVVQGKLA